MGAESRVDLEVHLKNKLGAGKNERNDERRRSWS